MSTGDELCAQSTAGSRRASSGISLAGAATGGVFSNAQRLAIHTNVNPGGGDSTWEEEGDLQGDVPLTQNFAFTPATTRWDNQNARVRISDEKPPM